MVPDRIHVDRNVCGGKATIRGIRVTVDFMRKPLRDGCTAEAIVREYPETEEVGHFLRFKPLENRHLFQ